jgi:hypothetical protein
MWAGSASKRSVYPVNTGKRLQKVSTRMHLECVLLCFEPSKIENVGSSTSHNPTGLCYKDSFALLYFYPTEKTQTGLEI